MASNRRSKDNSWEREKENRRESAALGYFSISIFVGQKTIKNRKTIIVASQYNYSLALLYIFIVSFLKKFICIKYKLENFLTSGQRHSLCRVLGPQISMHICNIKKDEIKDFSTQCCLILLKNEKRLFMNSRLVLH